jgi:hypothetical protein
MLKNNKYRGLIVYNNQPPFLSFFYFSLVLVEVNKILSDVVVGHCILPVTTTLPAYIYKIHVLLKIYNKI